MKDRKEYRKKYNLENKEKIREYRLKNKIRIVEQHKEWHQNNKERIKKHQLKNRDKVLKYKKKHYLKNKEILIIKSKIWAKNNPEKMLEIQIRQMTKLGFPFKIPPQQYAYALTSWSKTVKHLGNGLCQVCNMKSEISHHIVHKSKYPELSLNVNNGIPLCKKCHYEVHGWKI